MSFKRTVIVGTNALGQLLGREQAVGFNHGALAMHPAFRSMGLSQGLCVGRNNGRIRTPLPEALTCWLCSRIQVRTILLQCQEAFSQISSQARFPWASSLVQHQARNCVVMSLTGRPRQSARTSDPEWDVPPPENHGDSCEHNGHQS